MEWVARRLEVADVRCWDRAALDLPRRPGGDRRARTAPGKTSLVEAVVLGCLGVSPRTAREAEIVRHGADALHVTLELDGPGGPHRREIGFAPGRGRRLRLRRRAGALPRRSGAPAPCSSSCPTSCAR